VSCEDGDGRNRARRRTAALCGAVAVLAVAVLVVASLPGAEGGRREGVRTAVGRPGPAGRRDAATSNLSHISAAVMAVLVLASVLALRDAGRRGPAS
jgi:hypothetical protein